MKTPIRLRPVACLLALAAAASVSLSGCRQQTAPAAQPASAPASQPQVQPVATPANVAPQPAQTRLAPADLQRIVSEVMEHEYPGARDAEHGCWTYASKGQDELSYCMRPHPAQEVMAATGPMVYFHASNATDIRGNPDYAYASPDAGLMAAFQVSVSSDGRWTLLASEKAMPFGTAGSCGCEDAKFLRLGKDVYGWAFTSGGMWQGVIVSNHEIVVPGGSGFKDISDIPDIREEAQDVEYRIAVMSDVPERERYPLRVEKYQGDRKVGERIVEFDRAKGMYAGIGDF